MQDMASGRWLARATGVAASFGALYILLKDDVVLGRWSDSFVLVPVMVIIAIAAGHLSATALRNRKILSAFGFALAFVLGTGLVVYTSVGKQAATSDATTFVTEAHNKALSDKQDELTRARLRHQQALAEADRQITDGGCKRKCDDWKTRAKEVQARISELEAEVKSMGPTMPVAAKADRVAQIAHMLFGFDHKHTKAVLVLVEPFLITLLFEVTAITAFGYGFGHRRSMSVPAPQAVLAPPAEPQVLVAEPVPEPGIPTATKAEALADLQRLLANGATIASQDELAARWNVGKGTASKWLSDWEQQGIVTRTVQGRTKLIRAA